MACYSIPNLNTNGANLISVSEPVDWHQNLIMLSIDCQTLHAIKKIQGKPTVLSKNRIKNSGVKKHTKKKARGLEKDELVMKHLASLFNESSTRTHHIITTLRIITIVTG